MLSSCILSNIFVWTSFIFRKSVSFIMHFANMFFSSGNFMAIYFWRTFAYTSWYFSMDFRSSTPCLSGENSDIMIRNFNTIRSPNIVHINDFMNFEYVRNIVLVSLFPIFRTSALIVDPVLELGAGSMFSSDGGGQNPNFAPSSRSWSIPIFGGRPGITLDRSIPPLAIFLSASMSIPPALGKPPALGIE